MSRKIRVSFHRPSFKLLFLEITSGRVKEVFLKSYAFFLLFTEHIIQKVWSSISNIPTI